MEQRRPVRIKRPRTGIARASRFGPLDCGFNVAGLGRGGPIIDQSADDWNFVLGVCLTGVFYSMKHEGRR